MMESDTIEHKIEEAIRLIVKNFPDSKNLIKPTVFHSIRVGLYLYDRGYKQDVCIAGILHDVLEDTKVSQTEIKDRFGNYISELVEANSQNEGLPKEIRKKDLISRCANHSEDAMIIKCADIIDNYQFWSNQKNESEVKRCIILSNLIKEHKLDSYLDRIFEKVFSLK